MPSKKKPRPLFEVPAEIGSGHESGWVYRSGDSQAEPPRQAIDPRMPVQSITDTSIYGMSANALTLALAAAAQTLVLTVTVAALPMTMGIRAFQSLTGPDEGR